MNRTSGSSKTLAARLCDILTHLIFDILTIKIKFILIIFLGLTIIASSFKNNEDLKYDFNKKYRIDQLKADFRQFRDILQSTHPRLYEYTSKEKFDFLFDSLYNTINYKMTEREFQYFLTPIIGKVHCSHTKLLPSKYLAENLSLIHI